MLFLHATAESQLKTDALDQAIKTMSLKEKIGHLFLIGFPYQSLSPDLQNHIHKHHFSNFILFKRNIKSLSQVKILNAELQKSINKNLNFPALIALDQEGGAVSRLPLPVQQPSALSAGQTKNSDWLFSLGKHMSEIISDSGFNVNLAPVLDLTSPYTPSFLGSRSLGSNPDEVSRLGLAFSKGLMSGYVIPTAKHFPGVGGFLSDPHFNAFSISTSYQQLKENDLKPFSIFSSLGPQSIIMISHHSYPSIDPTNIAATFSTVIKEKLLRDEYKFQGVVLTDDLQMKASTEYLSPAKAALKALMTGSDLVMMTWSFKDQTEAYNEVYKSVLKKELTLRQLNQKVKRVLVLKKFASQKPNSFFSLPAWSKTMLGLDERFTQNHFNKNLVKRGLASVQNNQKICIISSSKFFLKSFQFNFQKSNKAFWISEKTSPKILLSRLEQSRCDDIYITIGGAKTAKLASEISSLWKKTSIVIINMSSPFLVSSNPQLAQLQSVDLFSNHKSAGKVLAESLLRQTVASQESE
ncbi:MAG: glycoside hydrolase family 3 N-terminal domain-containing protein [Pseudobdellovibrionaceae bacterium]